MRPRERLLTALRRQVPDRMPWCLSFTPPIQGVFRQRTGSSHPSSFYDFDFRDIGPGPPAEVADFSRYYKGREFMGSVALDPNWGFAQVRPDPDSHLAHWESPFGDRDFTVEDARTYPLPDYGTCRYERVSSAVDAFHAEGYAVRHIQGFGTLDRSWLIRGYETFLADLAVEEKAALILMDRVSGTLAAVVGNMAAQGVDIVGLGEDVGTQSGLLMSPRLWRKHLRPRLAKIVDAAKAANPDVLFFYHSDGDIHEIIPDLIEIGVDVLNPIQPECMDPVAVKETYGRELAFWGAVGTQTTMPYGRPDDVRRCVRHLFETVGEGGGYVCAPSHVLEPEVPWENIEAFVGACRECVYGSPE